MRHLSSIAVILVVVSLLADCAMPSPAQHYVTPPGLTADNGATIVGSRITPSSLAHVWVPSQDVFPIAVDGQVIVKSTAPWTDETLITPGEHVLSVAVCECHNRMILLAAPLRGETMLTADFLPGESYTLHSAMPEAGWPNWKAKVWMTDSQGRTVGQAKPAEMLTY